MNPIHTFLFPNGNISRTNGFMIGLKCLYGQKVLQIYLHGEIIVDLSTCNFQEMSYFHIFTNQDIDMINRREGGEMI